MNASLARRLWPAGDAIDSTILIRNTPHQVVGVVSDIPLETRTGAIEPWVYVPFWQNSAAIDARLAIRVTGDPAAMLPVLVREVNRVDRDVPIAETIDG